MSFEPSRIFSEKIEQFGQLLAGAVFTDERRAVLDPERGFGLGLDMLGTVRRNRHKVYVIGNGGSAAIASHVVNDLVNNGKLQAGVIHDAALLTCMANDYGYAHAYAHVLETQAQPGDLLVAVSSSGQSPNILNAVAALRARGGVVLTLSGFHMDNPLRTMGDLNFWLDSRDYAFVEIGHLFLLHHLTDRFKVMGAT